MHNYDKERCLRQLVLSQIACRAIDHLTVLVASSISMLLLTAPTGVGAAQPPPPPVEMLALHPQCLQPSSPRRLAWCAVCGAVYVGGWS